MGDEDNRQCVTQDPRLSRRAFGVSTTAAAIMAATAAKSATEMAERDVDVATPDGSADAVPLHPTGQGNWPAVLIGTNILALPPVFRQMGKRLAAEGYVVLVPNPFYRVRRAPIVEGPFDFANPADRAKVMPLTVALTPDTTARDASAFVDDLDAQPQTKNGSKAGVQGDWSGGRLTFHSAAARPDRFAAAATFHGGSLVTDKPTSPHLLIPKTTAIVRCAAADNDDKRDPKAVPTLREAFIAAHRPARVEFYQGANHGWCVMGSAFYDAAAAAAERAWTELTGLYRTALV